MKYLIFIFSLLINSSTILSQNIDSLNILISNKWTPQFQNRWLDKDTFYLKSIKAIKSDFIKLCKSNDIIVPNEDADIIFEDKDFRDLISFDSMLKVNHKKHIICLTGETIYNISEFKYENGKVLIHYSKRPWNGEGVNRTKIYDIYRWDEEYIVLIKSN